MSSRQAEELKAKVRAKLKVSKPKTPRESYSLQEMSLERINWQKAQRLIGR